MTTETTANDSHASNELERGSFAPPDSHGVAPTKVIVASYNIRYAVGSYLITGSLFRRARMGRPRRRPRLVARHIERAARALSDGGRLPSVDILALQEADKETLRAGGHHVALELARELRMHYAHAANNLPRDEEAQPKQWYLDFEESIAPSDTGDTGVAILSRFPFTSVSRIDLPWTGCAWRPRLAIGASVHLGKQSLQVFNVHIDPHATLPEQLEQHRSVLSHAASCHGPAIVLGDFNTLTRNSCVEVRRFLESQGYQTPLPDRIATWRAGLIRLHPDWIFVRGLRVTRWGVGKPLGVSDHWPVWVEIDLESEPAETRVER
jgi:endonuclease/exonuclease/phosphatase family metal-dependent hydrolase